MSNIYKVDIKKIENSDKFRPAAIHFEKYGYYTAAPKGTTAYMEYWTEEKKRCLKGYIAKDGQKVSGYFYFYLNFCVIKQTVKDEKTGKVRNTVTFPRFYDYDYEFFKVVEAAEKLGKHLAVLKARRKGYSYKIGSMMCRNFFLIPDSKNYAYAAENEFLIKDGILTKAWDIMDFVDENTAWYKKRQKTDTKMCKRASLVVDRDGVKVELGYKSEIIGVTLKNDVNKCRGKSGKLIVFEEAGKLPNLKTAWTIARPSVEQGADVHGLLIAFGTGGSEDADFEGLRDLFYEPEAYNILPIENIWDEGASRPCGFFVPTYYNLSLDYMDNEGNSNIKEAIRYSVSEREKVLKNATDRSIIDRYVAENCMTPVEATLQISSNIFPKVELQKHLSRIRTNKNLQTFKQVGTLEYNTEGELKWTQATRPKDLTKYRIEKNTDLSGQIVIWEHPVDVPVCGLYIAGLDPYDHDKSSTNSLGSCFIYKRFSGMESYSDIIVAEYTGRPETAEEYYENVRKLLLYYNAKCLYENERKGIFQYFSKVNSEYLLADQPDIVSDIIQSSSVQRRKGIHMTQQIKDWMELRIRDWLIEEYAPGKMNLTKILSEPLLEELILYNDKGNFDRVIGLGMIMIYKEELHKMHVKEKKEETVTNVLFPGGLFVGDKEIDLWN